jgi:itaconyl-CoA hydratase
MGPFLAYVPTGEKRFRERFGLDFEQFAVGQRFKHRPGLTLSQQDSRDECLDTLNQQMLHFDEQFAAHGEWKRCLLDSTLTAKVVFGMTWKTFAKRTRLLGFDEITLTKPLFGGATLYAESEILETADWPEALPLREVGSVAPMVPITPEPGHRPQSDKRVGRLKVRTQGLTHGGEVVARLVYDLLVARAGQDDFSRINY